MNNIEQQPAGTTIGPNERYSELFKKLKQQNKQTTLILKNGKTFCGKVKKFNRETVVLWSEQTQAEILASEIVMVLHSPFVDFETDEPQVIIPLGEPIEPYITKGRNLEEEKQ
jgi:sRNA-binding regulator protein Hfq